MLAAATQQTHVRLTVPIFFLMLVSVMSTLVNMPEDEETVAVDMTMVSSVNIEGKWNFFKGELRPEISLLHMKVLTLIKAKSFFLTFSKCYFIIIIIVTLIL